MNRLFYHYQQQSSRLSYRLVLISLLITLGLFVMMPMLEYLVKANKKRTIRAIDTAMVIKKNPPVAPPRKNKSEKPKPELMQQQKRLNIMPIDMALSINPGEGDFSLNFGLDDLSDAGQMVFEIAEVDKKPEPVRQPSPLYPLAARHKKIEGNVRLEFIVMPNGRTEQIRIIQAMPSGVFDQAAMNAVEKWRFKPGVRNNKVVPIRMGVTLEFDLD